MNKWDAKVKVNVIVLSKAGGACYFDIMSHSLNMALFQLRTLKVEKTVIVELGTSHSRFGRYLGVSWLVKTVLVELVTSQSRFGRYLEVR